MILTKCRPTAFRLLGKPGIDARGIGTRPSRPRRGGYSPQQPGLYARQHPPRKVSLGNSHLEKRRAVAAPRASRSRGGRGVFRATLRPVGVRRAARMLSQKELLALLALVYFAFAELLSEWMSQFPLCIVVSENQSNKNRSGYETCATLFEGSRGCLDSSGTTLRMTTSLHLVQSRLQLSPSPFGVPPKDCGAPTNAN